MGCLHPHDFDLKAFLYLMIGNLLFCENWKKQQKEIQQEHNKRGFARRAALIAAVVTGKLDVNRAA